MAHDGIEESGGSISGIVTEIQRFSLHDGPGIRSTVFLKGCNLRCAWCHNPETLHPKPEVQYFPDKCLGCGWCLKACPHEAHEITPQGHVFHRSEHCTACGNCTSGCYAQALVMVGRCMTADEVAAEVRRDRPFYQESGGGVTLSGGEPLCQPEFSRAILQQSKAEGLNTAMETNLAAPWHQLQKLLPWLDLVLLDLKHLQTEVHREWTGVPNERIIDNARRLGELQLPLIVRTPVVPGVNDDSQVIDGIAALIASFPNLLYYELLPYHPLGTGKYQSLEMSYRLAGVTTPAGEVMQLLAETARRYPIEVRVAR